MLTVFSIMFDLIPTNSKLTTEKQKYHDKAKEKTKTQNKN